MRLPLQERKSHSLLLSMYHVAAILLGCNSFKALKDAGKIALITKVACFGNVSEGKECISQQFLAIRHSSLIDIFNNANTCLLLEDAAKIGLA